MRVKTKERARRRTAVVAAVLGAAFALRALLVPLHLARHEHAPVGAAGERPRAHAELAHEHAHHAHAHHAHHAHHEHPDEGGPAASEAPGSAHAPHAAADHLQPVARAALPPGVFQPLVAPAPGGVAVLAPAPGWCRRPIEPRCCPRPPPPRDASAPRAPPIAA